ncbi:MAG TPA: S-layer homology domain-containing protein [Thermoanaerobaculia bacterium]
MKTPRPRRTAALCLAFGLAAFSGAFAGTLTVRPGVPNVGGLARYNGTHGLEVNVASPSRSASFVQSSHPSGEATYRARFYVNLRGLSMSNGDELDLFAAYDGADPTPPTISGNAVVRVVVRQAGGVKLLSAFVRTDIGFETEIADEIPLTNGWRGVEINWARATAAGANNGRFDLWVDGGAPKQSLVNLDNDTSTINYARLGTVTGVDTGTSGIIKLDDFASQRTGYIGLITLFTDVPSSSSFWPFVQGLYASEITTGCATGLFCPNDNVTRATMAVFLERAMRGPGFTPPAATGVFADVPTSYWAAAFIEQFRNDGITTGCASGPLRFCPENLVTRAEMAVFLLRAKYGSSYVPPAATGTRFTDVSSSYWAAAWIEQLANEGITTGCTASSYCPETVVPRWQMAVFLVRTFGLPQQQVGS